MPHRYGKTTNKTHPRTSEERPVRRIASTVRQRATARRTGAYSVGSPTRPSSRPAASSATNVIPESQRSLAGMAMMKKRDR